MASTNQSPQYQKAQGLFLQAKTNDEKLHWLDEMIKECPKHKSAESMLANLKTRRKKLLEKIESARKTSRGSKRIGIKKEDMQAVIIGFTNSGKSSLLSKLTNATPNISKYLFTTKTPVIGMMKYLGLNIQIIEIPPIDSESYDRGVVNTADSLIILINNINQISKIEKEIGNSPGKRIFVFNIFEKNTDLRKLEATLRSKKLNYVIINSENGLGISELKKKIFESFEKIRIYTKEPGKEKSEKPFIFTNGSKVADVAKKIFKDISKVKETKLWGPSSKFPGQIVGLNHELKDLDVLEFRTR